MVQVGDIVRTRYAGQPLVVLGVTGGCRCPDYLVQVDCDGSPCGHECNCDEDCPLTRHEPPHLHLVCVDEVLYRRRRWRKSHRQFYGGYVPDGPGRLRCIWQDGLTPSGEPDVIEIVGHAAGSQLALAFGKGA